MRRKPVVFMTYFYCISKMRISLTFSLESFSYTFLGFGRKRYTLEMFINRESHTCLQMGGPLGGIHLERAQDGMDS